MSDRIEDGGPAEAGLVERLRERAVAAREESTATGLGDALHFEEAARAIEEAENDTLAAEAELRLVRKERSEAEAMVAKLTDQLMAKATEASSYRDACKSAGICMACVLGAPDAFGCTDCLNTGFDGGRPVTCTGYAAGLEAAAEAANGIEPDLLKGMSERYVSIYCAARVDASLFELLAQSVGCRRIQGKKQSPGGAAVEAVCRPHPLADLVAQDLNGEAGFVAVDLRTVHEQARRLVDNDDMLVAVKDGQFFRQRNGSSLRPG